MYQKYGSDRIRNLLVDVVNSTSLAYISAVYNLKAHDADKTDWEEQDEQLDSA